ncbi:hypothetical protein LA080_012563 [Diaporthe eres]|nr:hypothetical protein LA080_012563 [Diaporthe eres]
MCLPSQESASYTMKRTLLISGQRANFTTLSLDVDKRELSILAEYPAPYNVSWVEPWSSNGDVDRLIGLSEGTESGLLYTFEIDHARKRCNITSQKSTLGDPAHFGTLHDRCALALSTTTRERSFFLTFPTKRIMYVLGELSHTVVAFDLSTSPAEDIQPIDGFFPSVVPPSVHSDHQLMMDSAEICLHPNIPNVLYVSNRWERHIAELEPHLENVPKELPPGDAIAIILLSDDGRRVQETNFVRTNLDTIRGMRLSSDGSLVALGGQEGGGVEIYSIGGERGDVWTLVASLNKGLESGIKHAIWL